VKIAGFYNQDGYKICEALSGNKPGDPPLYRASCKDGDGMAVSMWCETTGEMIAAACGHQFIGTIKID